MSQFQLLAEIRTRRAAEQTIEELVQQVNTLQIGDQTDSPLADQLKEVTGQLALIRKESLEHYIERDETIEKLREQVSKFIVSAEQIILCLS